MSGPNVTRGLILAVSCLVLGFVGGWSAANLGGKTIALPQANLDVTVQEPAPVTGQGEGTTSSPTVTGADKPVTATSILVLNASGIAGRAAQTQTVLRSKGYTSVAVDNAELVTGNTIYYGQSALEAASKVGTDLQITATKPLDGSPYAATAKGAVVIVVLGR